MISKHVLKEWYELLENDRINTLAIDMEKVLKGGKSSYETEEMVNQSSAQVTFRDIKVGDLYDFTGLSGKWRILNGARVQVQKKNRTKVEVTLTADFGNYPAGHCVTTPPDYLKRI